MITYKQAIAMQLEAAKRWQAMCDWTWVAPGLKAFAREECARVYRHARAAAGVEPFHFVPGPVMTDVSQ